MKYSTTLLSAVALFGSEVIAFPAAAVEYANKARSGDAEAKRGIDVAVERYRSEKRQSPGIFIPFEQYVSNQGKNAFVAPNSTDARGPCPGLNAMANHGYIPHNGVATISQFVSGCETVFGMSSDLGGFLAFYGALFDGNLQTWSIGGATPNQAGVGDGITNSHNKYESDVSPTRPDLYQYGNDYKVIVPQFEQLYAQPLGPAGYDLTVLTKFRNIRFQQSINNNPYFFNGPFSGVLVQPAAYTFIYRFMANKSAEYPEGYLDGETLKSFFSITGTPGSFVWTEGHEAIPNNWYKRSPTDEYSIPFFLEDVFAAAEEYPEFLDIGGNTGKPNTFTGVNFTGLVSGVANGATLLSGDAAVCFAFQTVQQALPDLLKDGLIGVVDALGLLSPYITKFLAGITCPQINGLDESTFSQYPGAKGTI